MTKTLCFLAIITTFWFGKANSQNKFVKLFNGKDLNGWYAKIRSNDSALSKKVFTVSHKTIHVYKDFPIEYELNTGKNNTHGMLFTKNTYSKFILKFEYKWGKGIANNFAKFQYDAGVFYHVIEDKIWPKGIEYQIRYNHVLDKNHTGDFWSPVIDWYSLDGNTFTTRRNGGKLIVKPGEHLALNHFRDFNALNGKWNTCEIIVMGDKYVIHKLNGNLVNMATNLPYTEGAIGFQAETAEICYRNIKIKTFKDFVPMEIFMRDW